MSAFRSGVYDFQRNEIFDEKFRGDRFQKLLNELLLLLKNMCEARTIIILQFPYEENWSQEETIRAGMINDIISKETIKGLTRIFSVARFFHDELSLMNKIQNKHGTIVKNPTPRMERNSRGRKKFVEELKWRCRIISIV